jgi:hypothetical protein
MNEVGEKTLIKWSILLFSVFVCTDLPWSDISMFGKRLHLKFLSYAPVKRTHDLLLIFIKIYPICILDAFLNIIGSQSVFALYSIYVLGAF